VLQCVAVCCSVVQCGAVCCSILQYTLLSTEQSINDTGERVAVCCSVLQCVAVWCNVKTRGQANEREEKREANTHLGMLVRHR